MTMCWSQGLYAEVKNNEQEQDSTKISITPWPRYEFTDAPDLNSILIKGSWIGDAGGNFVYEGMPTINTVEIICNKSTGSCIESRAEVSPLSGNLMVGSEEYVIPKNLMVHSEEYVIVRWDKDGVEAYLTSAPYSLLGHTFGTGKLTLRINRNNKTTTLIGEYETDEEKGVWDAHLDSGEKLMEIYRSKRKNEKKNEER